MNRIARFFDAEYADYMEDLPALQAYAQRTDGPLLELGCGTGRLLIPLARAGYAVTGVDLSPEMLAIPREKRGAADLAETRGPDRGGLRNSAVRAGHTASPFA